MAPAPSEAASSLLELDLITRDLAAKPGVGCAVIAAAGTSGAAVVLSCGRPGGRPATGPRDFVSRAVRAQRTLSEPLDPIQDTSLRDPSSGALCAYGISAPITVPGGRAAALCAGLAGPPAGSPADLVWIVDSYARLASLWLSKRPDSSLLGTGRDELTGCLTYAALLERLHRELDRRRGSDVEFACCFVSLESPADDERDRLLAAAGKALRAAVAEGDVVGRYGRAQFIVLLPGADIDGAVRSADCMRASVNAIDRRGRLDARVGVAQWVPGTGADRLLGDADRSLATARNMAKRKAATAR